MPRAKRAKLELRAMRVLKGTRVHRALLEMMVTTVPKVPRENKVLRVTRARKVTRVNRDPQVRTLLDFHVDLICYEV